MGGGCIEGAKQEQQQQQSNYSTAEHELRVDFGIRPSLLNSNQKINFIAFLAFEYELCKLTIYF